MFNFPECQNEVVYLNLNNEGVQQRMSCSFDDEYNFTFGEFEKDTHYKTHSTGCVCRDGLSGSGEYTGVENLCFGIVTAVWQLSL